MEAWAFWRKNVTTQAPKQAPNGLLEECVAVCSYSRYALAEDGKSSQFPRPRHYGFVFMFDQKTSVTLDPYLAEDGSVMRRQHVAPRQPPTGPEE
jgi:hypothetical protein